LEDLLARGLASGRLTLSHSVEEAVRTATILFVCVGTPQKETQAFLRRRLSEVRDNYLSKNEHLLTAAKAIQRRFLEV